MRIRRGVVEYVAAFVVALAVPASGQPRPPANLRDVALPVLERVAAEDPARWACAHTGRACSADWIRAAAAALHAIDPRFGLNGKRGDPGVLSEDVVTFLLDASNPRMVAAWDVCGACGSSGASIRFDEITDYATIGRPGTAIWVAPPTGQAPRPPDPGVPPVVVPPVVVPPAPAVDYRVALEVLVLELRGIATQLHGIADQQRYAGERLAAIEASTAASAAVAGNLVADGSWLAQTLEQLRGVNAALRGRLRVGF
jgi:hypothetical protein